MKCEEIFTEQGATCLQSIVEQGEVDWTDFKSNATANLIS